MTCKHCDKPAKARGMCAMHYNREYRKLHGFPTTGWRKEIIDGKEMGVREIVRYIRENRDYTLTRHTIARRMNAGLTGEDLIGPPKSSNQVTHRETKVKWPQKLVRVSVPGWGVRT